MNETLDINRSLVEGGDLDALVRRVDDLCAQRAWDGLDDLHRRCRAALERGKQLWPVAAHIDYRLALEAPAAWACATLADGRGQFAPGPLTEVIASTHGWEELAPHLPTGPAASHVAFELVARGHDLTGVGADPSAHELPLASASWEPAYPSVTYRAHGLEVADPPPVTMTPVEPGVPADPVDDPDAVAALRGLVGAWIDGSNGRAETVAVAGDARGALAALGVPRPRMGRTDLTTIAAHMAWAGSSGGAQGRRRGLAAGRFETWWTLAALAGVLDDWPLDGDELARACEPLVFHLWDASEPATGWRLNLVVEDPDAHLAWALGARDAALT